MLTETPLSICSDSEVTIGNDIVDLSERDPDIHPKFKQRVLTELEQKQVGDSWALLWLHWAAKEAAYKALKRQHRELIFSPKTFQFDISNATIKYGSDLLYSRFSIEPDYVYLSCAAKYEHLSSVKDWIFLLPDRNSKAAKALDTSIYPAQRENLRSASLDRISKFLGVERDRLEIRVETRAEDTLDNQSKRYITIAAKLSDPNVPYLFLSGQRADQLISLTDHGRFGACAIKY